MMRPRSCSARIPASIHSHSCPLSAASVTQALNRSAIRLNQLASVGRYVDPALARFISPSTKLAMPSEAMSMLSRTFARIPSRNPTFMSDDSALLMLAKNPPSSVATSPNPLLSAGSHVFARLRIGSSAAAQKFELMVSCSSLNLGPRSLSTSPVSLSAATITPIPMPNPAKMPGRARPTDAMEASPDPMASRLLVPARAAEPTFMIAVLTPAIAGTLRSRFDSAVPSPRIRSVTARAPDSASNCVVTAPSAPLSICGTMLTVRIRVRNARRADAHVLSTSGTTGSFASSSSMSSTILRTCAENPAARSGVTGSLTSLAFASRSALRATERRSPTLTSRSATGSLTGEALLASSSAARRAAVIALRDTFPRSTGSFTGFALSALACAALIVSVMSVRRRFPSVTGTATAAARSTAARMRFIESCGVPLATSDPISR